MPPPTSVHTLTPRSIPSLEPTSSPTSTDVTAVRRSTEIAVAWTSLGVEGISKFTARAFDELAGGNFIGSCTGSTTCTIYAASDADSVWVDVAALVSDREVSVTTPRVIARESLSPLISLLNTSEAAELQGKLTERVFGPNGAGDLASTRLIEDPCLIEPQFIYCMRPFGEAATTQILEVTMELGLKSRITLLTPERESSMAVIYHRGHEGVAETPRFRSVIGSLLSRGHPVALISMPFFPPNAPAAVVDLANLGTLMLTTHNDFAFIQGSTTGSPLKFFMQPIVAAVDYLSKKNLAVAMIGLSGGGWSTSLAAALEPRIQTSVAVAGSVPLKNRSGNPANAGDWEQWLPGLVPEFSYPLLYVLGTFPSRTAVLVYNDEDPCCFASHGFSPTWQADVSRIAESFGGEFFVLDESSNAHDVGPEAMKALLFLIGESSGHP